MRKRLSGLTLALIGLGVPAIVALLTRSSEPASGGSGILALATPPGADVAGPTGARPESLPLSTSPAVPPSAPLLEPQPQGLFAAIGRFDYRFRRVLPVLGLALVIGVNVWAGVSGGQLIQGGWVISGSQEQEAVRLLEERFPADTATAATLIVVYRDPDGHAASPAFQAKIDASLVAVAHDSAVTAVATYANTPVPQFLSRDGSATMAVVTMGESIESAVGDAKRLTAEVRPLDGVKTYITGIPQLYGEFNDKIEHDLVQAELISLPIALVILLAVFGTLVGAGLPLLMAGLALPTTFAMISLLAGVTDMSVFVTNLASMIGLALAIDYSLFMVSRFREELRHHTVEIAVERMMGSVGKAVAISGVAVAVGLSSLTVFQAAALRSMGYAGIITVLSTLLYALTVLPSILALLGPRVNRLRIPMPRFLRIVEDDPVAAERRQGRGVWAWVAARVMRRPLLVAGPILALLLVAGLPFLSLQLSTGQNLSDLPRTPARTGFEVLQAEFPGGESDPVTIAVQWPGQDFGGALPTERQADLEAYVRKLAAVKGATEVQSVLDPPSGMDSASYRQLLALPPAQRPAQAEAVTAYAAKLLAVDTAKVTVFSTILPDSNEGRALVGRVRAIPPPPGAVVLTGGLPSRSADFMTAFNSAVPVAILIVVLVTGGVLFLTFGSILLPIKAVLMSLVSISASFGALVWIFQEGHLADQIGFEASGATAAWLPLIMFAILFGLSMDYEVFLLSRIRERYLATGDNTRAVAEGIGITGGIITGAALIMVAVFAAFGLSSITFIKALGLVMALAVLIDATLVRGLLVPAFMRVMGRANWWAPRWVQRGVARLGLYEDPDQVQHTQLPALGAGATSGSVPLP
jgi:trehalose monomycolate/heme transporter